MIINLTNKNKEQKKENQDYMDYMGYWMRQIVNTEDQDINNISFDRWIQLAQMKDDDWHISDSIITDTSENPYINIYHGV